MPADNLKYRLTRNRRRWNELSFEPVGVRRSQSARTRPFLQTPRQKQKVQIHHESQVERFRELMKYSQGKGLQFRQEVSNRNALMHPRLTLPPEDLRNGNGGSRGGA